MENSLSRTIRILIGVFVLIQAFLSFYILVPILLTYYRPDPSFLIPWVAIAMGGILGFISGIGILMRRKWGVVTYLVFSIYPLFLLYALTPLLGIGLKPSLTSEDWLIFVNSILAIYMGITESKTAKSQGRSL